MGAAVLGEDRRSPPVPSGLRGTTAQGNVPLTWSNGSATISNDLQWSADGVNWNTLVSGLTSATSYLDQVAWQNASSSTGLIYYRIRANSAAGSSAWSSSINLTPFVVYATYSGPNGTDVANYTVAPINAPGNSFVDIDHNQTLNGNGYITADPSSAVIDAGIFNCETQLTGWLGAAANQSWVGQWVRTTSNLMGWFFEIFGDGTLNIQETNAGNTVRASGNWLPSIATNVGFRTAISSNTIVGYLTDSSGALHEKVRYTNAGTTNPTVTKHGPRLGRGNNNAATPDLATGLKIWNYPFSTGVLATPPDGVIVFGSSGAYTVIWNPQNSATSYDLQYQVSGSTAWVLVTGVNSPYSLSVANVTAVQLRANSSVGTGNWSQSTAPTTLVSPLSLSPYLWYDAEQQYGTIANGATFGAPNDASGNGNNGSAVATHNPTFTYTTPGNSKDAYTPEYTFAGNQTFTAPIAMVNRSGTLTFFFVSKVNSVQDGILLCTCNLGGSAGLMIRYMNSAGTQKIRIIDGNGGTIFDNTTTTPAGSYAVIAVVITATGSASGTVSLYENGTLLGTSGSYTGSNTNTTTATELGGDSTQGINQYLMGGIKSILSFTTALSSTNVTAMTNFLKALHGI